MEETQLKNKIAREAIEKWQHELTKNVYTTDPDLIHTIRFTFPEDFKRINSELEKFGALVSTELEATVSENHLNLPKLEGDRTIVHHPSYSKAGDIIYGTKLLEKMSQPGGMAEGLSLFFLSSEVGEAGHNCPIACSAGILRVFSKTPDFEHKKLFQEKLITASYQNNFTGAQFLTEVQGGSDVGANATFAKKDEKGLWRITGEKWFCSNADADLIFVTARFDEKLPGTKGLGLFLVPAVWKEKNNLFTMRRLKDKIGTQTLPTAEIDFHAAFAYPMGELKDGFRMMMENVLHVSRLCNAMTVLAMARRAYHVARLFAKYRIAFDQPIINYPLIKENLARIKAENTAMIAGSFATARLQDELDLGKLKDKNAPMLLRLLANSQKYITAKWSFEHIHHCLGVLAGNGTIETFSPIPRLLRDGIVCENWEGTHNILRMQILRDILKYNADQVYLAYMQQEIQYTEGAEQIKQGLIALEKEMTEFRTLSEELQALKIRLIVDQMAILYNALKLLQEAIDQKGIKLDCFRYFCELRLKTTPLDYDQNYLALISRLI